MKILNFIIILSLSLSLVACKDKVTSESNGNSPTVINPPVTPNPNDNVSPIKFKGIDSITDVKEKGFTVHWTPISGAGSYQIFFLTKQGLILQKSFNHPKTNYVFTNLEADTEYKVVVRLMDLQGRIDVNENVLTTKTNAWPDYHNNFSLSFNGSNGVLLGKANEMINKKAFTLSLWVKAQAANSNANLLSFHKNFSATIGLGVMVKNDYLGLKYLDGNGDPQTLETKFNYYDNKWHHIAVTFNSKWYALYINGKRVKRAQGGLSPLGQRPATLGFSEYSNGFAGLIDEASIWTSALGRNDIGHIYNNGKSFDLKQHDRVWKLRSWYRLGDDQNDSDLNIQDQMNKHNGTPQSIQLSDFEQDSP